MKRLVFYLSVLLLLLINFVPRGHCQLGLTNPILSTESDDFSDLAFLDSLIANKNIVFLGESMHGVEDFNKMKFRIIRFLHEHHNFSVVVFEAGVHEAALTNLLRDSLNSLEMLTQALMGYWRTASNCAMMEYLSNNQIDIAGMDLVSHALPPKKKFYTHVYSDDTLADTFFHLDSLYNFGYRFDRVDFYHNNRNASAVDRKLDSLAGKLLDGYKEAVAKLENNQLHNTNTLLWANHSLIQQIEEMNDIHGGYFDHLSSWRDSSMASNLMFVLDSIFPNQKTIVWAHDFHISKTGDHQLSNSIGKFLDESIKERSLFIGLGAINGTTTIGMNPPHPIKLKRKNLERKYNDIATKGVFVHTNNLDLKGWNSLGSLDSKALTKLFDGFIFLKDVRGSNLLRYNDPNNCKCEHSQ